MHRLVSPLEPPGGFLIGEPSQDLVLRWGPAAVSGVGGPEAQVLRRRWKTLFHAAVESARDFPVGLRRPSSLSSARFHIRSYARTVGGCPNGSAGLARFL